MIGGNSLQCLTPVDGALALPAALYPKMGCSASRWQPEMAATKSNPEIANVSEDRPEPSGNLIIARSTAVRQKPFSVTTSPGPGFEGLAT
jgi:hypothetical protein